MIEAIFLLLWTTSFFLAALSTWLKIKRHSKVYLLMLLDFLFLTGVFLLFPGIETIIGSLYEYFA